MKQRYSEGIRIAITVALILVTLVLVVGLIYSWVAALAFIIGGIFFTLCCFLSYYRRTSFVFNNLMDTNQSGFLAYFTNTLPRPEPPRSHAEQESFKPFTFKQETDKELEDMRVRALLRQVFPDEEAM